MMPCALRISSGTAAKNHVYCLGVPWATDRQKVCALRTCSTIDVKKERKAVENPKIGRSYISKMEERERDCGAGDRSVLDTTYGEPRPFRTFEP